MAKGAEEPLYQVVTVDERPSEEQGIQVRVLDLKMKRKGKRVVRKNRWRERMGGYRGKKESGKSHRRHRSS